MAEANRTEEQFSGKFDLEAQKLARTFWGLFRDRRPELYKPLLSLDGSISEHAGRVSRHERTVICWPARSEIYGSRLAEAQTAHAALATPFRDTSPSR